MFKHTPGNIIHIGRARLTEDQFRTLEPDYKKEECISGLAYDSRTKTKTIYYHDGRSSIISGIPWIEGDRYIQREFDFIQYERLLSTK